MVCRVGKRKKLNDKGVRKRIGDEECFKVKAFKGTVNEYNPHSRYSVYVRWMN